MTQAVLGRARAVFTPSGLRSKARSIHRPQIELLSVGWICVAAAIGLSITGILAIGTVPPAGGPNHAVKQIAFLLVALLAGGAAVVPHFRWLCRFSVPLLALVVVLLVFVMLPFVPESIVRPRNGARRWINLVVTDFQPSELAKIAYVVALASYLRYRSNYRRFLGLLRPFVLTFVPMGLILVEPDLGTALLFLPTLLAMLVAAGAKLRHLVLIVVIGLASAPLMYPILQDHQKDRIQALVYQLRGDQRHVQSIGYQGAKAMTLVGSGQVAGVGRGRAADLVAYNHLPEQHNDMIFAVIACRWGALGGAVTMGLFGLLTLGALVIAAHCKDPFGRLTAVGLGAMLFAQMAINVGMTVGLMPITGMTLPFVSYGGSSLVSAWIMVGLLLNIAVRRPQYLARESFEFDGDGGD